MVYVRIHKEKLSLLYVNISYSASVGNRAHISNAIVSPKLQDLYSALEVRQMKRYAPQNACAVYIWRETSELLFYFHIHTKTFQASSD